MDGQLKKGVLTICILQLIAAEDRYGYDIVKIMQEYFSDTEESVLYAILRRINNEGLTEAYTKEYSLGPKRKYYRITEAGRKSLQEYIESWHHIESVFGDLNI
jgi:PadR family transcriptional regulator PadR